ncbi:hypothetical protein BDV12DRAFT_178590 [Aspergillus spectabilis]
MTASTTSPKQNPHSALSANKVPTIQSLGTNNIKRSASYNVAAARPDSPDEKMQSPTGEKVDQTRCDNMLKASLTGLLNAGEVKYDARGRKVQNLLMETQHDLRKQRRESLDQQDGRRKRMSLEVISQGLKS